MLTLSLSLLDAEHENRLRHQYRFGGLLVTCYALTLKRIERNEAEQARTKPQTGQEPSYDSILLLKIRSISSGRASYHFKDRPFADPCCLILLSSPPRLTLPLVAPPPDVGGLSLKGTGLVVVRPLVQYGYIIHAVEHDERELRQVELMDLKEELLSQARTRRRLFPGEQLGHPFKCLTSSRHRITFNSVECLPCTGASRYGFPRSTRTKECLSSSCAHFQLNRVSLGSTAKGRG
jgi:hypothetical protein